MATASLRPNADVAVAWDVTPSGTHWSAIDDDPDAPNLADYITTPAAPSSVDEFSMTTQAGADSCTAVQVRAHCEATDEMNELAASVYMGGAWTAYQVILSGIGGAAVRATSFSGTWTQTDVNNLAVRIRGLEAGLTVYAMEANITYTSAATAAAIWF